ncbi:MAG: dephospho-CoA kinase, partial [Lachnospiraceae bacterium]|nr:dephospho-CoA kinase [Lachnospiraceae bacterium]
MGMKVIGITGGVGAGKSTVVGILRKHFQTEYLHCDVIAHEVMEPGGSAYTELVSLFGNTVVNDDGTINRNKLYEAAFLGGRVEELNACVHP